MRYKFYFNKYFKILCLHTLCKYDFFNTITHVPKINIKGICADTDVFYLGIKKLKVHFYFQYNIPYPVRTINRPPYAVHYVKVFFIKHILCLIQKQYVP